MARLSYLKYGQKFGKAEQLVTSEDLALDETLRPSLETAISETKAAKKDIPEMPATLEEINEVTKEITAIDYSDAKVITGVDVGGSDKMAMVGHAYMNEGFSALFRKFIEKT